MIMNNVSIWRSIHMISFKNDYSEGAHSIILERILKQNNIQNIGDHGAAVSTRV